MCRKPVDFTGKVFAAFYFFPHNFTTQHNFIANNLAIKQKRRTVKKNYKVK